MNVAFGGKAKAMAGGRRLPGPLLPFGAAAGVWLCDEFVDIVSVEGLGPVQLPLDRDAWRFLGRQT